MDDKKEKVIKKRKQYAKIRKQKNALYKKDERLSIRVSPIEKKAIKQKAKELNIDNMSDYVVSASLNNIILKIDFSSLDQYSKQLSAFGNLVNQIVRVLNEARFNESINEELINETNDKLSELKNYYDENLLILQKNMDACSSIKRHVLSNMFDPEDYDEEDFDDEL